MPSNTILDIALSNPDINGDSTGDFNILGTALGLFPDLVAAAGNPGVSLTVFAPTDQAFLNLANAVDPSVGNDEDKAVSTLVSVSALLSPADDPTAFLKTVLTYHIAGEALTGAQVVGADSIDTLAGKTIKPDGLTLGDKDADFADPNVTNPVGSEDGIVADNGILHVIDNVLLPFDITISDGGFVFVGAGHDAVIGSDSFDFIGLGRGNDIANGLDGNDVIFGGRGNDLAIGGDGNDKLFGGRGGDTLEGGADHDYLYGGRGRDSVDGGEGNDKLFGGRGGDTLDGGADQDYLYGGRGRDSVDGGEGNDKLFGGRGGDTLDGGSGHDYLNGGRGSDFLTGQEGDDYLKGGGSADHFIFSPFREGEGHDVVKDFNPSYDKLVLDLTEGSPDLLASIAAEGDEGLQFTDLLTFDVDPGTGGVQAPVSLGASDDGDLLITHLTGTIELNGIASDVDPADLIPAIQFLLPDDMSMI